MAKTTNPLLSLSATGTVARTVEYRRIRGVSTAQRHGNPTGQPTAPQAENRAAWAEAATAWRALTPTARAQWSALAATRSRPPFAQFAKEWRDQRIEAPALPVLPIQAWSS